MAKGADSEADVVVAVASVVGADVAASAIEAVAGAVAGAEEASAAVAADLRLGTTLAWAVLLATRRLLIKYGF
jgi:hypothetical protein